MNTVLDDFGVHVRNSDLKFYDREQRTVLLGATALCPSGMNKSTLGCYFIKLTLQSSMSNINKGNNKITELRTIFQRESQNS